MRPRVPLWCAVAWMLAACAPAGGPSPAAPEARVDTVMVVDTVTVGDAGSANALRDENSRLQMQILERDAHIADLEARLDNAMQEAVRSMARVQTATSRAEAASALAEAEIAVENLRTRSGGAESFDLVNASELLRRSNEAFDANNFGGAAYLAGEATIQARQATARLETREQTDEQLFLRPVRLTTSTRSNVRAGPGTNHAVRFTVDPGTVLTGHAHSGRWIRVTDADNREGWIFQSLVTGRD